MALNIEQREVASLRPRVLLSGRNLLLFLQESASFHKSRTDHQGAEVLLRLRRSMAPSDVSTFPCDQLSNADAGTQLRRAGEPTEECAPHVHVLARDCG